MKRYYAGIAAFLSLAGCSAEDLQTSALVTNQERTTECQSVIFRTSVQVHEKSNGSVAFACGAFGSTGGAPALVRYGSTTLKGADAAPEKDWTCTVAYSAVTFIREPDETIRFNNYTDGSNQAFNPGECIQYNGGPERYIADIQKETNP